MLFSFPPTLNQNFRFLIFFTKLQNWMVYKCQQRRPRATQMIFLFLITVDKAIPQYYIKVLFTSYVGGYWILIRASYLLILSKRIDLSNHIAQNFAWIYLFWSYKATLKIIMTCTRYLIGTMGIQYSFIIDFIDYKKYIMIIYSLFNTINLYLQ